MRRKPVKGLLEHNKEAVVQIVNSFGLMHIISDGKIDNELIEYVNSLSCDLELKLRLKNRIRDKVNRFGIAERRKKGAGRELLLKALEDGNWTTVSIAENENLSKDTVVRLISKFGLKDIWAKNKRFFGGKPINEASTEKRDCSGIDLDRPLTDIIEQYLLRYPGAVSAEIQFDLSLSRYRVSPALMHLRTTGRICRKQLTGANTQWFVTNKNEDKSEE